jgi:hypothetical protein
MPDWKRLRILVWGKTRPELSMKYREIVCTGGVLESTRELVRLYPIPLRFMNEETVFAKYNLIEADVMRNPEDSRPESYKIRWDTIKVVGKIKTKPGGNWDERAEWVLAPGNECASVEELKDWQEDTKRSLAIMKPGKIAKVEASIIGASEKAAFVEAYNDALRQFDLQEDPIIRSDVPPLKPGDYRFKYTFSCHGRTCKHTMTVLDWEIDALYTRMKKKYGQSRAEQEVVITLEKFATAGYDLRFFLGNLKSHPANFTIVGLWYPKAKAQSDLPFDDDVL